MDTLRRVLILCRKELLSILKDPSSRIVLIGPIIMQSLIFGYAATYDLSSAPYALLDRDRSSASAALVAKLEGSGVFRRVADLQSSQQIASVIDSRQALLVVQIEQNFARQLASGAPAPLQVVVDGRNSNTAGVAFRYVAAMVASFNADWRSQHGGSAAPPLTVESRAWYNPNLETRWQMVPSLIAVLSMLQTMILTALSVAREREQGTFDQLLVTPLRSGEIMVGKAVPSIIIGLAQSTLVLLLALFWFRIPFAGSLLTLYVGLLVYMVASVGIGLAISALSANMQQAMLYAFVLLMPLMLLSGLATPIASMPKALQYVTLIDPVRYGLEIVRRVYLEDIGLTRLFNDLWPLAVMALVTLPTAAWLFRNRLT